VDGSIDGGVYKSIHQDQIELLVRNLIQGTISGILKKLRPLPNHIHLMILLYLKLQFGNRIISNKCVISLFSRPQQSSGLFFAGLCYPYISHEIYLSIRLHTKISFLGCLEVPEQFLWWMGGLVVGWELVLVFNGL
jgi:hypothetical protein